MKKSLPSSYVSSPQSTKKQKFGGVPGSSSGLMKFGFTGRGVKSEEVSSPSAAVEYSQCPHCGGLFNTLVIVEHASTCMSKVKVSQENSNAVVRQSQTQSQSQGEDSQTGKTNAFDLMRKSAALKAAATTPSIMHFAMILKDEKLLPVFSSSADYIEQLYTQCNTHSDQPPPWTCEANVKKFRWSFTSAEASHRDIRLHLSTNIQPDMSVSFADTAAVSTAWLKSMLQKAVRRRLSHKAVKLANMMCKMTSVSVVQNNKSIGSPVASPVKSKTYPPANNTRNTKSSSATTNATNANNTLLSELLRRLPIICVEDAALHPAYPILIWLMVAVSKGYTPPKHMIHVVLLITSDIASCTYKDCAPPYEYDLTPTNNYFAADTTNSTHFATNATINTTNTTNTTASNTYNTSSTHTWECIENDSFRTLLACICIRASFGGMTGDMMMLDKYAQMWYIRLLCDDNNIVDQKVIGGVVNVVSSVSNVGGVVDKRVDSVVSESISAYLHSSYSNAFFSQGSSVSNWGSQMYGNFNNVSSVAYTNTVSGECITISAVVERALTNVCNSHTNNTTTAHATITSITRPTTTLPTLLRLTQYDLVPEGLDQHCDYSLLPAVLNMCNDKVQTLLLDVQTDNTLSAIALLRDPHLEANIKSAIWLFRSSNNSRKLYPYILENLHNSVNQSICTYNQELVDTDLAQKRKLARLWGVVCPLIVAYCDRKMVALTHRL